MPRIKYHSEEMWAESLTLSLEDAAKLLGISPNYAREAAKNGQIPYIRVGRLYRVPKVRLMAMINGEQAGSMPGAELHLVNRSANAVSQEQTNQEEFNARGNRAQRPDAAVHRLPGGVHLERL